MEKIHIGDRVAYKDPNSAIGKMFPSGTVEDVIPDGLPLGNGERNVSGQDVIICRPEGAAKTMLMFIRSELVKK